jgi:hypothetical protein
MEQFDVSSKGEILVGVSDLADKPLTRGGLISETETIGNEEKTLFNQVVGTTGIEPVTPTMSR